MRKSLKARRREVWAIRIGCSGGGVVIVRLLSIVARGPGEQMKTDIPSRLESVEAGTKVQTEIL